MGGVCDKGSIKQDFILACVPTIEIRQLCMKRKYTTLLAYIYIIMRHSLITFGLINQVIYTNGVGSNKSKLTFLMCWTQFFILSDRGNMNV